MNNSFDIFVDSAANLTDEMVASTGIKIISYICTVNGKDMNCYESGKPFSASAKAFYELLSTGAEVKTSLVGEETIIDAVTPSLQAGKDVLFITISSGISGTYSQAVAAQKTLKEKFPEAKFIVADSANASLGEGLLAVNAARLRDMGESVEACGRWVEGNKYKMNAYLTVSDLKYLRKGGRISTTLAIAGTILNIKPIIKADGGSPAKLAFFSKERGRRKSLDALVKLFEENCVNPENQTVAIAHCNCVEEAEKLAEALKERGARDVVIEYYDICTGAHVGPGTIAVFFMGKDRRANAAAAAEKQTRGKTATQKI
ncbi:MAG: DegV family protein [Clostridia bacterium]|nr:DegV family protein [Clostridia bacterium]